MNENKKKMNLFGPTMIRNLMNWRLLGKKKLIGARRAGRFMMRAHTMSSYYELIEIHGDRLEARFGHDLDEYRSL